MPNMSAPESPAPIYTSLPPESGDLLGSSPRSRPPPLTTTISGDEISPAVISPNSHYSHDDDDGTAEVAEDLNQIINVFQTTMENHTVLEDELAKELDSEKKKRLEERQKYERELSRMREQLGRGEETPLYPPEESSVFTDSITEEPQEEFQASQKKAKKKGLLGRLKKSTKKGDQVSVIQSELMKSRMALEVKDRERLLEEEKHAEELRQMEQKVKEEQDEMDNVRAVSEDMVQHLEQEMATLRTSKSKAERIAKGTISKLEKQLNEANQTIDGLNAEAMQTKTKHDIELQTLRTQLEESEAEKAESTRKIEELEEQCESLTSKLTRRESQQDKIRYLSEQLNMILKKQEERNQSYQKTVVALELELDRMRTQRETELDIHEKKVSELEDQLKQSKDTIDSQKECFTDMEKSTPEQKEFEREEQQLFQDVTKELEEAKSQLKTLEGLRKENLELREMLSKQEKSVSDGKDSSEEKKSATPLEQKLERGATNTPKGASSKSLSSSRSGGSRKSLKSRTSIQPPSVASRISSPTPSSKAATPQTTRKSISGNPSSAPSSGKKTAAAAKKEGGTAKLHKIASPRIEVRQTRSSVVRAAAINEKAKVGEKSR